jgi:hypothetical protein
VAGKGRGKGQGARGADGKVGLGYLGLGGFLLYFFLDSIKPVWFGPVQYVLSFFKPEPNRIGWFFYFLIGLFSFFYRFCFFG